MSRFYREALTRAANTSEGFFILSQRLTSKIMDKLESKLKKINDWRYELYLLIKKALVANTKNYKLDKAELDKKHKFIFHNAMEIIGGNKSKYLIVDKNKWSKQSNETSIEHAVRVLINQDESIYQLNKKEIQKFILLTYIFPIINNEKDHIRAAEMTGKKLTDKKKKVLQKIIDKRNELRKTDNSSQRSSWKVAIKNTYKELSEQEKRELLNLDPSQNIPIRLVDNQIKNISESIRRIQKNRNLPK